MKAGAPAVALFKKPKRSEEMDEHLAFLTRSQADDLRSDVRRVFAELGLEVHMHPDHAVDDSGRQFGFWNVATQCVEEPRDSWPSIIRRHVQLVLASMDAPDPFEGLSIEEAARRTFSRLYDVASVPSIESFPHQEFAPGIVEMLALDLPETVAVFSHDNVRALGGWEDLRRHGLSNLRVLPTEALETLQGPGGATITALIGDSVYTASRALLLPQLASALTGEEPGQFGWLMSTPNRHQVVWHVIRDATVVGAVEAMARFTALGYSDAPGPVSPHVFWWNGDAYEQLTHVGEDGALSVRVSPVFQGVLETATQLGR
jgi:hypothetical protein